MKKKTLLITGFVLFIVLVTVIVSLSVYYFVPQSLSKYIDSADVETIAITNKSGKYDEEKEEYVKKTIILDNEKQQEFLREIDKSKYKNRTQKIKAVSLYYYEIMYTDGSKILLNSYSIYKYSKDKKIVFNKEIYLIANLECFYSI